MGMVMLSSSPLVVGPGAGFDHYDFSVARNSSVRRRTDAAQARLDVRFVTSSGSDVR
jgi:hypothetical protein